MGEKLTDAELIGVPLRLIVGRKGFERGVAEAQLRAGGEESEIPLDDPIPAIAGLLGIPE